MPETVAPFAGAVIEVDSAAPFCTVTVRLAVAIGQGTLLSEVTADAVARLVSDSALRRRIIAHGYDTARAHTLQAQAALMMRDVSAHLGLALRQSPAA